jgi:hypothetical protein
MTPNPFRIRHIDALVAVGRTEAERDVGQKEKINEINDQRSDQVNTVLERELVRDQETTHDDQGQSGEIPTRPESGVFLEDAQNRLTTILNRRVAPYRRGLKAHMMRNPNRCGYAFDTSLHILSPL